MDAVRRIPSESLEQATRRAANYLLVRNAKNFAIAKIASEAAAAAAKRRINSSRLRTWFKGGMGLMSNDPEQNRRSAGRAAAYSGAITLTLLASIFTYCFNVDGALATRFSKMLSLDVDLGQCALGFSKLLMAETIFSIAVGIAILLALLLICADIYTLKRRFSPYQKLLPVLATMSVVLLVPLISHDGAWMSGGRRGLARVSLGEACAASQHVTFYRLHVEALMTVFLAWTLLLAAFTLRRSVALGRGPNQLSDKPEVRAMQLALEKSSRKRLVVSKWIFKLAVCGLAAVFFVAGSVLLSFSFWRAYHSLTWPRQQTTVVAVGTECVLENRRRRGAWMEHSVIACSDDAAEAIRRAQALEKADLQWRVSSVPTAELRFLGADKSFGAIHLRGNFVLPTPLPVGSQVTLLQDPEHPDKLDRVFERRDTVKTCTGLLVIILSAATVYFLLIRKRLDQPTSTA